MNNSRLKISLIKMLLVLGLLAASSAQAGSLFRSYLSANGSDSNPCTLPLPCRLLPAALAAAANNGEVWILDSGNFNTSMVTISQSVVILAIPGVQASILVDDGTGMAIDINGAFNVNVVLRNLSVRGFGGNEVGIRVDKNLGNAYVTIDNSRFTEVNVGVVINSTTTNGAGDHLLITHSEFIGIGNAITVGDTAGGAQPSAVVDHCTIAGGSDGLEVQHAQATVSHNTFGQNSATAIDADQGGVITLEDNIVAGNGTGAIISGGTIKTIGHNTFDNNGTPVSGGSLTTLAQF